MVIDRAGVVFENLVLARARCMLQFEDGLWVKQVEFAFAAPLVFPAQFQVAVRVFFWPWQKRAAVTGLDIGGEVF